MLKYKIYKAISIMLIVLSWFMLIMYFIFRSLTQEELKQMVGDINTKRFFLSAIFAFFIGFISFNIFSFRLIYLQKQKDKKKQEEMELKSKLLKNEKENK